MKLPASHPAVKSGRTKRYPIHPLSEHAPQLGAAEFGELEKDITEHGLQLPIVIFEEQILDGRHRERACYEREIKPRYEQFKGTFDEARAYVWSTNGVRRHLTAGQKAALAAGLANAPSGGVKTTESPDSGDSVAITEKKTVAQVAKDTGVSPTAIGKVKQAQKVAPELAKQLETGEKTVDAVDRQVKEIKAGTKTEAEAVAEKKPPAKKAAPKTKADIGEQCFIVTLTQLMDLSTCDRTTLKKWLSANGIKAV